MFKDGKIFGKINIIDFVVIFIVVLLIVGATIKFKNFNSTTEENANQMIEYKLKISDVREYTLDGIQIGDTVFDSQTGVNIGKVIDVNKTPAKTYEQLSNGKVELIENPYKYDAEITIETPGTSEQNAYYANKTIEIKVDGTKIIETKYVKTTTVVSDIKIR